jgi:hypothetical protein
MELGLSDPKSEIDRTPQIFDAWATSQQPGAQCSSMIQITAAVTGISCAPRKNTSARVVLKISVAFIQARSWGSINITTP